MPEAFSTPEVALFQQAFGAALAGDELMLEGVMPEGLGPALSRALAIHRNTSAKAARDAVAANYPVVRALCGDEAFDACASAFIAADPPREPRLNAYGARFPAFLSTYAPADGMAYLAEVAALERLYVEALFAADAPALDGTALAAGLDLEAPLSLHPAARFAAFDSPAVAIWSAHRAEDEAVDEAALSEIDWRPQAVLVVRPDLVVEVMEIDAGALAFLSACAAGEPLGQAALAASEAGCDLQLLFANLITAGAFA
ncbi:MAG: DNA-binding domain-containing protein [Caulobacteraceae bacterium]